MHMSKLDFFRFVKSELCKTVFRPKYFNSEPAIVLQAV